MKKIKIQILLVVVLFGNTLLIHGMMTQGSRLRRLQTVARSLPTQSVQPTPINIPTPQPGSSSGENIGFDSRKKSPFLNQKELLGGTSSIVQLEDTTLGQYMRNWLRSWVTSWWGPKSTTKTVVKSVMPSVEASSYAPLVTGVQKRSYSAFAQPQHLVSSESISSATKSEIAKESEDIIKKLHSDNPWGDYKDRPWQSRLGKQIKDFLSKNNVDEIDKVFYNLITTQEGSNLLGVIFSRGPIEKFIPFLEKYFDSLEFNLAKVMIHTAFFEGVDSQKIEHFKKRIFDKINPDNVNKILSSLQDTGYLGFLLPSNIKDCIEAIEKIENAFKKSDIRIGLAWYFDEIITRIIQEKDEKNRERLCAIIIQNPNIADTALSHISEKNMDVVKIFISVLKKNILDNNWDFRNVFARKLLNLARESDSLLAEDFGIFMFQQILKKSAESYVDEMKYCLIDVVRVLLLGKKDITDGLIEFIILHAQYPFSDFNRMINQMLDDRVYRLSKEEQNALRVKFSTLLISIIKKYKPAYTKSQSDFKALSELMQGVNDSALIETIWGIDKSAEQTPSYRHLQKYHHALTNVDLKTILKNPNFVSMVQQSMLKEKELIDSGYEVFYHARRWKYKFLSDIYGMLYSYKSGKELKDFIFTHLDDPVLGKISEQFYSSEQEKREQLLKEGNIFSEKLEHPVGVASRGALLFLNKFLFGNLTRETNYGLSSNSIDFVLRNINIKNIGDTSFSIEEIFNMFGYPDAYQMFANELQALQEEYNNITQYGELLQIAVPKDIIDKCIYYTTSGGPKIGFNIPGHGETTDVTIITEYLDKNLQDQTEFVLVNTRDKFGGLNPESGIKVFSYGAVDPEKMAALKEKQNNLFNRIQEWMKQKGY